MWIPVLPMLVACAAPGADAPDQGRFTMDLINDLFGTTLDEGYSSGIRFAARFAPFVGDGFSAWMPRRWQDQIVSETWSLGVQWDIYTPFDLEADTVEALRNDRPYAGYMGGIFGVEFLSRTALQPGGYTIWSTALESGWVGPSTQTGRIQRAWHRWTRNLLNRRNTPRDPNGWGVWEVPDAFMLWLRTRIETDVFRHDFAGRPRNFRHGSRAGFRMSTFADCDFGLRRVGCDGGFVIRAGLLPDAALEGLFPVNTWDPARQGASPRFPLYVYLFTAVAADVTLYDAFLDGPVGVDSPTKNKRELGGEGQVGLLLRVGDFELFYRHIVLTREIEELPPKSVFVQQLGQVMMSVAWD
jgi:hypothetical protein